MASTTTVTATGKQRLFSTVMAMSPSECAALVDAAGYTDPHSGKLGDLADPMYRAYVKSLNAR